MDNRSFKLSNGVEIPVIGYGTGIAKGLTKKPKTLIKRFIKETAKNIFVPGFKEQNRYPLALDLKKDKALKKVTQFAADNGCALFDTARAYSYSEEYLGESLLSGKYKREDLFIITKVTNKAQRNNTVMNDFETSLKNLKTDYVDLYLLHWPQTGTYIETWKLIEEIYKSGRARAIGVCNCHIHHLKAIMEQAEIMPMVNELECHPILQQHEIRDFCKENGIQIIAHTPTGKLGKLLTESDILQNIAKKYNAKIAQVVLRWHYQLGDVSIPNTTSTEHLLENLNIFNFELTEDEMKQIKALDCGERIWPNPDCCDFTKL